jgi:hypothetical protein
MGVESVPEAMARIRAAYEADEEEEALRLSRELAPQALGLDREMEAAWELGELLISLGEERRGLELSEKQAALAGTDAALARHARLLRAAGLEQEAVTSLQGAAAPRGATPELAGTLIEFALEGQGWEVLAPVSITDPVVSRMVEEARRRSGDFSHEELDSRRLAYILSRIVVLGGSEDEGDVIEPYWFLTADETEVAWLFRRFVAWLQQEGLSFTAVRAGDVEALPVALALAKRLGIPHRTEPCEQPGCLRVLGSLEDIEAAGAPHPNDRLTLCLGVANPPSWRQLLRGAPRAVDVVGVFAPLELSWSEEEEPTSGSGPSIQEIAEAILNEERTLPKDRALPSILRFYARHREREP